MTMRRPRRNARTLAGCACGGKCDCKGDCPCKGGLGGFDPVKFDQALSVYERGAYRLGPQFGRQVSALLAPHYGAGAGLGGMGEDWSAADITPIDTSAFDSFIPAGSDSFDGGEIVITGSDQSGGGGPIDWTPWGGDLTPFVPDWTAADITAPDFSAIAQAFQNFTPANSGCFSNPGAFASCAVTAAKNLAKGITGGAGGGAAAGGAAAQAKPNPAAAKQASLAPFILLGLAVFAVTELLDGS